MPEKLFDPHGGYRKLDSFTLATIVYLETIRFCERFLTFQNDPKGRLYDQMVQAARSGRANIIEGSERSATSKETEIKLTDVARASLSELQGDYEIWLLRQGQVPWAQTQPDFAALITLALGRPPSWSDAVHESGVYVLQQRRLFARWLDSEDSCTAANALLALCRRVIQMLSKQIAAQGARFTEAGGFKERMMRVRTEARVEEAPLCPDCGLVMIKRSAKQGTRAGKPFWGCSGYPTCRGLREIE